MKLGQVVYQIVRNLTEISKLSEKKLFSIFYICTVGTKSWNKLLSFLERKVWFLGCKLRLFVLNIWTMTILKTKKICFKTSHFVYTFKICITKSSWVFQKVSSPSYINIWDDIFICFIVFGVTSRTTFLTNSILKLWVYGWAYLQLRSIKVKLR